jgi:glutamate/tyrosine decarboxylase-like PLP-dependent enzyme
LVAVVATVLTTDFQRFKKVAVYRSGHALPIHARAAFGTRVLAVTRAGAFLTRLTLTHTVTAVLAFVAVAVRLAL